MLSPIELQTFFDGAGLALCCGPREDWMSESHRRNLSWRCVLLCCCTREFISASRSSTIPVGTCSKRRVSRRITIPCQFVRGSSGQRPVSSSLFWLSLSRVPPTCRAALDSAVRHCPRRWCSLVDGSHLTPDPCPARHSRQHTGARVAPDSHGLDPERPRVGSDGTLCLGVIASNRSSPERKTGI